MTPRSKTTTYKQTMTTLCLTYVLAFLFNSVGMQEWGLRLGASHTRDIVFPILSGFREGLESTLLAVPRQNLNLGFKIFLEKNHQPYLLGGANPKEDMPHCAETESGAAPYLWNPTRWSLGLDATFVSALPQDITSDEITVRSPASSLERGTASASAGDFLLVGDSMLKTALNAPLKRLIENEFKGSRVDVFARSGTGLARIDVFDWPSKMEQLLSTAKKLKHVIIMIGTNDGQDFQVGKKTYYFGTTAWMEAYKQRVDAILDKACHASDKVTVLGIPPMRSADLNRKIISINQIFSEATHAQPCSAFMDSSIVLSDKSGHFAAYLPLSGRFTKVREEDGIHLSGQGAEYFAKHIIKGIKSGTHE